MRVLHPGWSQEVTCTGHGSGAPGCHSRLLVGKGDLFKSCSMGHQAHGKVEWYVSIRCPECGRTTDLGRLDDPDVAPPEIRANLLPLRAWEAHQVRAGEAPNMPAGVPPADLFNALREHTEAPRAARVAPSPPPETRTPAGDRLRDAAIKAVGAACWFYRNDGTSGDDVKYQTLIAAIDAYAALPAAPPRTTVEEFCSTAEGRALFEQEAAILDASEAVAVRQAAGSTGGVPPDCESVNRAALDELCEAAGMAATAIRAAGFTPVASKAVARIVRALAALTIPAPEAR